MTKSINKFFIYFYFFLMIFPASMAQSREVAITIDDVPNVYLYKKDRFKSRLLERIESLNIPVAIFINEKNIFATEFQDENLKGMGLWLKSANVTPGNHSYSHINYADTTLAAFQQDIINGEAITTKILNKRPAYFRFPFNSLGNDSIAHKTIRKFLSDQGYIHTPFTVESEDWAYNAVYEEALKRKDVAKARKIGEQYVSQTIRLFKHFESLSNELYGRNIKHIYLCHDNQLNTDFIEELVKELRENGYSFISLEDALTDNLYESKEYYNGRYGFSWLYRWERNPEKRKAFMRREPIDEPFRAEYEKLVNQK